jgi:hypothetical protein
MAWYTPSFQDLVCITTFLVIVGVSFIVGYTFMIDSSAEAKTVHMQTSILIYGGIQSIIGYLGGFCISKIIYSAPPPTHVFLRSDDDI